MKDKLNPFHLAIPVSNLEESVAYYRDTLGLREGRSSKKWTDFDFFGHQLVCHVSDSINEQITNPVDGEEVPVPHFGVVLSIEEFEEFLSQINDKNVDFKKKNIHQLVAETWVPNPHGYDEILHLDDNCKNNHYTNLKWGTHKENMAYKHLPEGTVRKYKGKSSTYVKKNGEWVLVPSNKPVWNRGLKGSSWNTLPDGTVSIRRVNSGYGKFIKQDGKWIYQGKTEVDKG